MAELQLTDPQAVALSGTTDASNGVAYPSANADPWLAQIYRALAQIAAVADAANNLRVCRDDASDLTIRIRPGRCSIDAEPLDYAGGTALVTDDDVTYVWAFDDTGTLTIGSAIDGDGWPSTAHIKLAEVTAADGEVTAILDRRGEAMLADGTFAATTTRAGAVLMAEVDSDTAALTDNSGGSSGSGTIAILTDAENSGSADLTPTANAIATLAAYCGTLRSELNGLRAKLRSAGILDESE